jgi:hypothetical protein
VHVFSESGTDRFIKKETLCAVAERAILAFSTPLPASVLKNLFQVILSPISRETLSSTYDPGIWNCKLVPILQEVLGMRVRKVVFMAAMILGFWGKGLASDLKVGDQAPGIRLKTDEGKDFD